LAKYLLVCVLLIVLSSCAVQQAAYNRADWQHWIDADGDCQDTRQEVLIAESIVIPTLQEGGCRVLEGEWLDHFTGVTFTDPSKLDIDHLVPLQEAHVSGGHSWTAEQRRQFANDLSDERSLIAVSAGANRSKGARDPAHWLPSNEEYRCAYVSDWIEVKANWHLEIDVKEAAAISAVLESCASQPVS